MMISTENVPGSGLTQLSNLELLENIRQAAARERAQTAIVLEFLQEVSRRMLHAELGYPSLFAFCVKELSYSEDQAHARISAMRLACELPATIKPALEDGSLTLTNLAQIQTFLRHERKSGKPYTAQAKEALVLQMQGLSKRECERKLSILAPGHARKESLRTLSESETRLSVVLDAKALEDLERLRALWGNQDLSFSALIAKLARMALEKADPEKKKGREKKAEATDKARKVETNGDVSVAPAPAPAPAPGIGTLRNSRFIPAEVKAAVWHRDKGHCTYSEPDRGRKCQSRFAVQFDHIIPFARGGQTTAANLRLRCRLHNHLHAVQIYGMKKMEGASRRP